MKSLIILIAITITITIFFTACKEDDPAGVIIDTTIDVSLLSTDGLDLLNPQTPNNLTEDDIQLFKDEDGASVKYSLEGNSDHPYGIFIFEDTPYYRIRLFPRLQVRDEFSVMYVKWGELGMDTLKLEIVRKNNNTYQVAEKVWFNGEKVYDQNIKYEERHFVITK